MLFLLKFLVLFLMLFGSSLSHKSYKNYKIFAVKNDAGLPKLLESLKQMDYSVTTKMNLTTTQILLAPGLADKFKEIAHEVKMEYDLLVDDFEEVFEGSETCNGRGEFSWTAYYDIDGIYDYLRSMKRSYSNWTELVVGGQTYEGRQILGLRINTPGDEEKPAVFIESGIHGREWIAPATTTFFINELLTSEDPDIEELRELIDWYIFPSVNPDGYQYSCTEDRMWRKTRSKSANGCYGADANRNWDYDWLKYRSSNDSCDYQRYAGSKPFSEIETKTLSEYIRNIKNLTAYISFHANAQALLIPYSDSESHHLVPNYADLVQIGNTAVTYGFKENQERYIGPAAAGELMYRASGVSMDWVKSALGVPLVYTFELRGDHFHWPAYRIDEQGKEVTEMMLGLVKEAQDLGYF